MKECTLPKASKIGLDIRIRCSVPLVEPAISAKYLMVLFVVHFVPFCLVCVVSHALALVPVPIIKREGGGVL